MIQIRSLRLSLISLMMAACGCAAFSGCAMVGPDYSGVSSPPLGGQFIRERQEYAAAATIPNWQAYEDDTLNMLIQMACSNSPNLKELAWRIAESRAITGIVSGQRQPFADAGATYERRKRSSNAQPFVASNGDPFDFFSVGVNSRWEIDIVGRIARETEAATADCHASVEDLNDVRRILVGDIARAYVQVRLYQELVQQNEANLKIQKESLKGVEARIKAGKVGKLDIFQTKSRVALTEADTPFFREALRLSLHRVAVLVGQSPNAALEAAIGQRPQVNVPNFTPGIPAELLRRRPDIRRSEREVAAACARIGVAEAEFYPRLSLNGVISLDSRSLSNLIDSDALLFGAGPSFVWNILSLGRIERSVEIQKAQVQQAIQRYRQNVLVATEEVENSLAAYHQNRQRAEILRQGVLDAKEAVKLASQQYEADKVSLERVISNQRRLRNATLEFVRARAAIATASVNLIQAVGGGNIPAETVCPTAPAPITHVQHAKTSAPQANSPTSPVKIAQQIAKPSVDSPAATQSAVSFQAVSHQPAYRLPQQFRSRQSQRESTVPIRQASPSWPPAQAAQPQKQAAQPPMQAPQQATPVRVSPKPVRLPATQTASPSNVSPSVPSPRQWQPTEI